MAPRIPACSGSRESPCVKKRPVEAPLDTLISDERIQPGQLLVTDNALCLGQLAVDIALDQLVNVIRGQQPERLLPTHQAWIGHDAITQLELRTTADQPVQGPQVYACLPLQESVRASIP